MVSILNFLFFVASFIFVLTTLVFVHEFGHYIVARYNRVKVEVFSIGLGPEIFGWSDRTGTRWRVSLIPLGGYVKMLGDAGAASTPDHSSLRLMDEELKGQSLFYKSVWQRIAVVSAGPLANYLFAFVLFIGLFSTVGQRYTLPIVHEVISQSAAEEAGFKIGDIVKRIQGQEIKSFENVISFMQGHVQGEAIFDIDRGGEPLALRVFPRVSRFQDRFGFSHEVGFLGIKGSAISWKRWGLWEAVKRSGCEVFSISYQSLKGMAQMITGARSADGLGGPLKIAQISGEAMKLGWYSIIGLIAVLSVSLGLINLFPIPVLDGGHIFLYFVEAIRGKPVGEKAQEWAFRFGLCIIAALMLFVTINDLKLCRFWA